MPQTISPTEPSLPPSCPLASMPKYANGRLVSNLVLYFSTYYNLVRSINNSFFSFFLCILFFSHSFSCVFPNIFPSELFSALNGSWWEFDFLFSSFIKIVKSANAVSSRALGAYGQAALDSILASLTYTLLLSMWAGHLFWVKKLKPANSALPLKKKNPVCVYVGLQCGGACVTAGVWRSDSSPPFPPALSLLTVAHGRLAGPRACKASPVPASLPAAGALGIPACVTMSSFQ